MTVGIDMGASAVKFVGYDRGEIIFTHSEDGRSSDAIWMLDRILELKGAANLPVSLIAVTGVGAESCGLAYEGCKVVYVPEMLATGEGGSWLAGKDRAVVVSLGTGTSVVVVRDGEILRAGGSGVGAGTVCGLAQQILDVTEMWQILSFAKNGDYGKVDLQIRDLFAGSDLLPPDLTACNMGKMNYKAKPEDWAAAIINLVLEVAGSHGALAAEGFGLDTVVITGWLAITKFAAECYGKFDRLYPQHFIIPPHAHCATAIGAARRAERGV